MPGDSRSPNGSDVHWMGMVMRSFNETQDREPSLHWLEVSHLTFRDELPWFWRGAQKKRREKKSSHFSSSK